MTAACCRRLIGVVATLAGEADDPAPYLRAVAAMQAELAGRDDGDHDATYPLMAARAEASVERWAAVTLRGVAAHAIARAEAAEAALIKAQAKGSGDG